MLFVGPWSTVGAPGSNVGGEGGSVLFVGPSSTGEVPVSDVSVSGSFSPSVVVFCVHLQVYTLPGQLQQHRRYAGKHVPYPTPLRATRSLPACTMSYIH